MDAEVDTQRTTELAELTVVIMYQKLGLLIEWPLLFFGKLAHFRQLIP